MTDFGKGSRSGPVLERHELVGCCRRHRAAGTAPPASLKSIATFWDFPAVTGRHGGRQLLSEAGTQVKLLAKAKDRQCSHVSRIASGFRLGPKPANKPAF